MLKKELKHFYTPPVEEYHMGWEDTPDLRFLFLLWGNFSAVLEQIVVTLGPSVSLLNFLATIPFCLLPWEVYSCPPKSPMTLMPCSMLDISLLNHLFRWEAETLAHHSSSQAVLALVRRQQALSYEWASETGLWGVSGEYGLHWTDKWG